jgi:hypothetical protein
MDAEELVGMLSREDLRSIMRCTNQNDAGSMDELHSKMLKMATSLPWKGLLICVPKESLQRICESRGLRSDLSKDELIDQIARLRSRPPSKGRPLRSLFSLWSR